MAGAGSDASTAEVVAAVCRALRLDGGAGAWRPPTSPLEVRVHLYAAVDMAAAWAAVATAASVPLGQPALGPRFEQAPPPERVRLFLEEYHRLAVAAAAGVSDLIDSPLYAADVLALTVLAAVRLPDRFGAADLVRVYAGRELCDRVLTAAAAVDATFSGAVLAALADGPGTLAGVSPTTVVALARQDRPAALRLRAALARQGRHARLVLQLTEALGADVLGFAAGLLVAPSVAWLQVPGVPEQLWRAALPLASAPPPPNAAHEVAWRVCALLLARLHVAAAPAEWRAVLDAVAAAVPHPPSGGAAPALLAALLLLAPPDVDAAEGAAAAHAVARALWQHARPWDQVLWTLVQRGFEGASGAAALPEWLAAVLHVPPGAALPLRGREAAALLELAESLAGLEQAAAPGGSALGDLGQRPPPLQRRPRRHHALAPAARLAAAAGRGRALGGPTGWSEDVWTAWLDEELRRLGADVPPTLVDAVRSHAGYAPGPVPTRLWTDVLATLTRDSAAALAVRALAAVYLMTRAVHQPGGAYRRGLVGAPGKLLAALALPQLVFALRRPSSPAAARVARAVGPPLLALAAVHFPELAMAPAALVEAAARADARSRMHADLARYRRWLVDRAARASDAPAVYAAAGTSPMRSVRLGDAVR